MTATLREAPAPVRSGPAVPLDALFAPRSIAVIGASEAPHSVGRAVMENLTIFTGPVFAVNPNHSAIFGRQSFQTIADLPEPADLAVIATPAETVPQIIRDCATSGVAAAAILSAGFRECGAPGADLERQILAEARRSGLRILGPNCLGVMRPHLNLNATFANRIAEPGSVAFLSQSGALCTAVLDWSFTEQIGFSAFVSVGSMLDINWGDLIEYFGEDSSAKSILCYMESVGDARAFMSAAREVASRKPIIVLKVGHTEGGARAAASHTGALTGSDVVLDAAFRRAGVLRVNTLDELFDMAEVLARQPRPHGRRLAIVTNAGGPGALATDMLLANGGELAPLSEGTKETLNGILPAHWSHSNPVDILGDADADRFKAAVDVVAADPTTDGILTILTPQAMTDPIGIAAEICECTKSLQKPVVSSWMGGPSVADAESMLNAAHIPTFKTPDDAARAFALLWQHSDNVRGLYETPAYEVPQHYEASARRTAFEIIARARSEQRTLLNQIECERILYGYGIPVVETRIALNEDEAVRAGIGIGFPVAVKLYSKTLTHKSDVGGVELNVSGSEAVRFAWNHIKDHVTEAAGPEHFCGVIVQPMIRKNGIELILGSATDAQFGPTITFGAGGRFVEIFKDIVVGLPPLNGTLVRRLLERTRIYNALKGCRGQPPVDLFALEQLIVRFSQLVVEQHWISEIEINPLFASANSLIALDARVILHPPTVAECDLPLPAIAPYPTQYVSPFKLKDGTAVTIRPIRAEDEPLMIQFHQTLSDRSVYLRYFTPFKMEQRIAHSRLSRLCMIDYAREMGLVAEHIGSNGQPHIVGIARLSRATPGRKAEFSVLVSDEWQGQGLGTELLRRVVAVGRNASLKGISGVILEENCAMQRVAMACGFSLRHHEGECIAEMSL